jgi:hypothetical protein
MLTCAVCGLCIAAVHAIEIVNSDVNIYQLLVSGFVLSSFSFQIFNMIIQICIMYDNLNVVQ